MAAHVKQLPLLWLCWLSAHKALLDKVCVY